MIRIQIMKVVTSAVIAIFAISSASAKDSVQLEQIAAFPTQQVTGIGVSQKTGRIFVNFPDWADPHGVSVAELGQDSHLTPFPDESWNASTGDPAKRWICVQRVVVDDQDNLWVLDPASPKMDGVVPGGAKLVKVDLKTNKVTQVILFGDDIASNKSYLNDVRIDTANQVAYVTESGEGSLVVVDLKSGHARRLLKGAECTTAEKTEIEVDGIKPIDSKTGKTPTFHADGIALNTSSSLLYFHALTGHTLYRVNTADLRNESLSGKDLESKVAKVAVTPKPDGLLEAPNGKILLTAIEEDAIVEVDSNTAKTKVLVKDKRLQWPDTMSWGPKGTLYITTSQIHRMPKNNGGVSKQEGPFGVFRLQLP